MRLLGYSLFALLVLAGDFITKRWIATRMEIGEEFSVIGDFFLIASHRNRGAAFGILQDQRIFFLIITTVILIGLVTYVVVMRNRGRATLLTGLSLILAGTTGNFIDRIRSGEVVDFLKFNFGDYTFPLFNVADSALFCGVVLILIDTLLTEREEKRSQDLQPVR
ncbi:signal peptidase II [Paenibacillus sp. 1P07SE]|uniref:signal peptidase II n=1 Tax=Paenibacillus sp. 1P07SE TaxID=3132209 RepID=UPI0039A4F1DE